MKSEYGCRILPDVKWYAIRVTYSREKKFKEYLDAQAIENFLPMQYKLVKKKREMVRDLVPVIHNLIFVKSVRNVLDVIKQEMECVSPMRYITDLATNEPIIVPESQMRSFIAVAGNQDEELLYLDKHIDAVLEKGNRVLVTGGIFSGVEGTVLRIKRDHRVVVSIKGIIAVATAFIHPSLLQKI
ncbi:MAG: UpxY family transcription antiterminator [Synergistaceae bacterium]